MLEFWRLPELRPQRSSEKYSFLKKKSQRPPCFHLLFCPAPLDKWIFLCETLFIFIFFKPRVYRPPERMSKCKSALFFASSHSQAMSRCFTDDTQHPPCLELDHERNSLQDFLVTSLLDVCLLCLKSSKQSLRGGRGKWGVPGKSTSALNQPATVRLSLFRS